MLPHSYTLVGASTWRKTPAEYAFTRTELVCSDNGRVERVFYDSVRRMQLSHQCDWRLRHYLRCRIHLPGRKYIQIHSDATADGQQKLNSFFSEMVARVAPANPNTQILHGIDHIKWFILVTAYILLCVLLGTLFARAPREPYSSIILGAIMAIYVGNSFMTTVMNWPSYVVAKTENEAVRDHAFHGYLSEVYEKRIEPLLHLMAFLFKPDSLVEGIVSRNKTSFRRALGGVGLAFFSFAMAAHLLVWSLGLDELKVIDIAKIDVLMLVLPGACFLVSFLFLRVLKYEDLAPSEYFHAFLYATALIVILEIATGVSVIFTERIPDLPTDWMSRLSPADAAACTDESSHPCVLAKTMLILEQRSFRHSVEVAVTTAAFVLWATILARFAQLTKITFRIRHLHGYLANFSALAVILALFLLLRSNLN
jgi:hypothetical protein